MLRIETILAPVDLSEASGVTLHRVSALARSFHSFITLLGDDVPIAGRGMPAGQLGRLRSQALTIIRRALCTVITVQDGADHG